MKIKIIRRAGINLPLSAALILGAGAFCATPARADYAVLRSGLRLHITGYEIAGDRARLTVDGGVVDVTATEVVSIEPEDAFRPLPDASGASGMPYGDLIRAAAEKHGVDEKLITDVIAAESNFNPHAVSRKQAQGLMQLLPVTAARYAVLDVFDPSQNIDAGTRYLKDLLARYSGDIKLALAAYNAGPDVVARYGGVPPFAETQQYVGRIMAKLRQDVSQGVPQDLLEDVQVRHIPPQD